MTSPQPRFLALDVFRGMTVCFMIIVNSPGDWGAMYAPLEHAAWHGFTPTDLVFPSFLFAVGNAMAFVMLKYEGRPNVFWRKTLKRSSIIFVLGFLLYWFPFVVRTQDGAWTMSPLDEARIFGVLQRIAICYLIASVILYYGSKKFAIIFSMLALVVYWIIMYGFGDSNDPYSLAGNAALKLDLALLGEKHLYHGEGVAFDPEGLLSTLPAIVNVIIGYLAGDFIRRMGNSYETIARLMIVGVLLVFVALTWNMTFPINKKIWTSSFVLLTVGIDLLLLAVLIYVIELAAQRRWTYFFVVFGRNPLFIYLLSEVLIMVLYLIPASEGSLQKSIYVNVFTCFSAPECASFLFSLFFMLLCWSMGYILDKRKIYIKV